MLEQKNKTSWSPSMLSRPQSYRKFLRLIVVKGYEGDQLYLAISKLKNTILDACEKIPLIQLQKRVDSMPRQIFEVIKANSGSTKH